MFRLLHGVGELSTSVFNAFVVFTEVTCHHDFVEEEFAFFFVWVADEVFVWHGEDGL